MELIQAGMCGTMESSDVHIAIQPNPQGGIEISLQSAVEKQYGKVIRQVITDTLNRMGINNALVEANDKGALDYAIVARTECAVLRAAGKADVIDWEVL